MAMDTEKAPHKVMNYVWENVRLHQLKPGDRIPVERVLAEKLEISRNSVREGLKTLENIGIIESRQGSGNYLSASFEPMMTELLSYMYFLKGINVTELTEFRWAIEKEALPLAITRIQPEEKEDLKNALSRLKQAENEEEQIHWDQTLHRIIVRACRNDFLIINYEALTALMDTYIKSMRSSIIQGMHDNQMLEKAHERLALGVICGDLDQAMKGLSDHFGYIEQYRP